ncbi:MAG: hypothetical protein J6T98_02585, partial [Salinivirgaceae bacterium]|nr:hypothetical protein [Salinivirgaceae bacterium]
GAQVSVRASMDTSMMLSGDQTNFRVEASFPDGYKVMLPVMADTVSRGLEIVEAGAIDSTIADGFVRISQKYVVTNFDSGWYAVRQLPFAILDKDGNPDTIYSEQVYYGVMTMPLDTANPNAICPPKPMAEAPFIFKELTHYLKWGLLILLAAFAVVFAVYALIKRKRNEPIFVKPKPQEPAHVVALRQLDQLKEQKLWQRGLVKEYYSSLTDIARGYLNGRFGLQAMESTTSEIMQMTKDVPEIDKDLRKNLQDLLERADFVKFAKAQAEANENEASFAFVEHFVLTTKPVEQLRDEDGTEAEPNEKQD